MPNLTNIGTQMPIEAAKGGTGLSTITDGGIMLGSGTGAVTVTAQPTNGQLLIGSSGGDPVLATLTEGSNITITSGAGSITIASTGGGLTWTEVTGTSQSAAVNNGYIASNAGLVTITIPSTAAVGDIVAVAGKGAGGWKVAQNASQTIHLLGTDTTTGVGGFLSSSNTYDCVELLCITANTDFVVRSSMGNITPT